MSKYVPDVSSRRWVIISSNRINKPENYDDDPSNDTDGCPFCEGNEMMTPKEVFRIGKGKSGEKGWDVRVIENKYPITDFHEVIIHSPQETDLHKLPKEHIAKVFDAYRERYNYYCKQGQVIIFCNQGEHAGASIGHPHSQLVVLANQINLSALCKEPLKNIVKENTYFDVYCPDFSQWPYEVWITPKKEDTIFGSITDEEITDLVDIYQDIMEKLEKIYDKKNKTGKGFSYNFYIYPKENWYLRIIPRMIYRAGFELGTGLSVNITDPEDVAKELRDKEPIVTEAKKPEQTAKDGTPEENSSAPVKTKEEQIEDLKAKLAALGID
ncbi:DUF4931 domain-containing protein [Candidatus Roizmanbacteria bacterium]|nr:MAG: DUF4931 domain-containing protein [Candidatus Roizmanbacteria bacterium]